MKIPVKRILFNILKISGITVASLLALMFLLPFLFPHTVTEKIKGWINGNINGNITFSDTRLSFFKHFPSLTLTLYNVDLNGSAPFQKDTLIAAKEISLGIDLSSLMRTKVNIDKIFLDNALIDIQVDSSGRANYNIYKGSKETAKNDTSSASLGIDQILVENSRLIYNDRSLPMLINARGLNYTGSGDLTKDIFDLQSHIDVKSADFYYGGEAYIISKRVNADLVTKINTKSLAFIFQKNDLKINDLPVAFNGRFAFLKQGYDMDFKVNSKESSLDNIVTALPGKYQDMLTSTDLDGTGVLQLRLAGKYIAETNTKPNLSLNFKIRNGYINNKKSPSPVKNLYLNFNTALPGLNPDSLYVNVDSIYFKVDRGYFGSVIRVKGVNNPMIFAKINSEIDLDKWSKAFGVKPFKVKGLYSLHLLAEGRYATAVKKVSMRKTDTVITSIPKFKVRSAFKDGYFKYTSLPQAVTNISFNLNADCPDGNPKHVSMAFDNINANALQNYLKGYFRLGNTDDFPVDAQLTSKFNLADIKQFYPMDGLSLAGNLDVNLKVKGKYIAAKKKFPVSTIQLDLHNGLIKTKYYPHPIQNIQVSTHITNNTGTLNGTNVNIKPISFSFEGEPFLIKAHLQNFADLQYNVTAKGVLDIGRIYQVFAKKDYDVKGKIAANISLKGRQSDALAKRYDKLANSGTLKVRNISLSSELFPKPFVISRGDFSFNQDKMRFDAFKAKYGASTFVLNGSLSNVIDFAVKPDAILQGEFNLNSDQVTVDDFMAFAAPSNATTPAPSASTGVILVPKNLDLSFTANVKRVNYNGLAIVNAKSQMTINKGSINLKQTGFNLIGAPVNMDAAYTSLSPKKAAFNYHIEAKDFDINKAYKSVKLFHDMVTAGAYTQGLISLDYQLSGLLNSNMQPVYPTLKGGGVLSAKQVKIKGFKLLGAIGRSTNKDSLTKPTDASKIEIKSTIAHNIITIERTKMRMAGFRARFEGQVGFDKRLNIEFRLGLPPLGIIGIPLSITGTQDKPIVHLGKGKKEDDLQGTNDDQ